MKALVIAQFFPPIQDAEAIVTGKFVAALGQAGVQCEVVSDASPQGAPLPDYWRDQLPEPRRIQPDPLVWRRRLKNYLARPRMQYWGTTLWWTVDALKACTRLVEQFRPDFIVTRALPEYTTAIGYHLWRRTGLPWVAYFSDPPLDMFPPPYDIRKPTASTHATRAWLRQVMPQVPMALFPSQRLVDYYRSALGCAVNGNAVVLPHVGWRAPVADSVKPARDPRRLRVMHLGELRKARFSLELLEGFRRAVTTARESGLQVELQFVGPPEAAMVAYAKENGLEDVLGSHPPVSYLESLQLMQSADALLLVEARLAEGIFLPSKFCDYAASGKPVLTFSPERGTISDLVGGRSHPGFMGQDAAGAQAAFERLFAAAATPDGLDAFRVPARQFSPEDVGARFLHELRAKAGVG